MTDRIWRGWRIELADWLSARRNALEWAADSRIPRVRDRWQRQEERSLHWWERRLREGR
jgi:hypothetical protein